jgi:Ca2+-dependent lipid-binding protein
MCLSISEAGIISLSVSMARNLDTSKSTSGQINSVASVGLGYDQHTTCVTQRLSGNHPAWGLKYDFFCPRISSLIIGVEINDEDQEDPLVGQLSLRFDDLLEGNETGVKCWPLSGCASGELFMSAVWRPLNLDG